MSETATETGTPTGEQPGTEQPTGEQQPTGAQPEAGTDPEGAEDSRVKRANAEAARYRTQLREAEAARDQATQEQQALLDNIAKALGLKPEDGGDDPAAQVSTLTSQVDSLTKRAAQLEAELLVHTLAAEAGGNPVRLLDSRSFTTALYGLDPAADDYRDKVTEAIKSAVEKDASLSAAGTQVVPSRGGAPIAGQGAGDQAGAVTQEQFNRMGYAERAHLFQTNPALYRRLAGTA